MKIIYDNKGRVTEVIGSGENGTLTEQEFDMFKFTLKCRSDEETIKQISVKAASAIKDISLAVTSIAFGQDNQRKVIDYFVDGYDSALDGLDLTGPKDEETSKPWQQHLDIINKSAADTKN